MYMRAFGPLHTERRKHSHRRSRLFLASASLVTLASFAGASAESVRVKIDGSSTVAPIMTATAEMFQEKNSGIQVTVGISGTGGGFKKFLDEKPDLRTDLSNASRPIKEAEMKRAAELGIEYIELPIALDGIAIVVHPSNTFCAHLTVAELKKIWEPGSNIVNWKDIRAGFPDLPLKLYGPGTDSGTFDYFTEAIVGKEKASRSDYTASENDNVLVQGVAGDKGSLGYFGFSYFEANEKKLKLLAVEAEGGKPIVPTLETIRMRSYTPLSRPLFLYVNRDASKRPEVRQFMDFFFDNAQKIVEHPRVKYVSLPAELYSLDRERVKQAKVGSPMSKSAATTDLLQLYR